MKANMYVEKKVKQELQNKEGDGNGKREQKQERTEKTFENKKRLIRYS